MCKHYFENGMDRGGWGDKYEIIHGYEIERDGEKAGFNPGKLDNKQLLWHGSRFSNFGGILSQGLKVAPPEAPNTGHKFGKGIYFADLSGLSICFSQIGLSKNEGLILLNEVALGKQEDILRPHYNAKPQISAGYDSVCGVGYRIPDPKENKTFQGMTVPCGKMIETSRGGLG